MSNPVVPGFRGLFRRLFKKPAVKKDPPPAPEPNATAPADTSRWWPSYYQGQRNQKPRSIKKRARKAAKAARRINR